MDEHILSRPYLRELDIAGARYRYIDLAALDGTRDLPVALQILIENVLRTSSDPEEGMRQARGIIEAGRAGRAGAEIHFMPSRVLFQDFTGVPVFCDFAAMRDAARERGGDPSVVNPDIPCVLVIDHSVTADVVSCAHAAAENARIEAERNAERFAFLKWSATSYSNVQIVPPGTGICHQLNIERFCDVVRSSDADFGHGEGLPWLLFDTLVGTDSHTTTANGIGVLGWGVGGIEAEAASLGQPMTMMVPPVVGLRFLGSLVPGATAMDVALTVAETLREADVVGSIVECFGAGVGSLSVTQRATIANMSPEYGCTATFFPADEAVLSQLDVFGRDPAAIERARAYLTAQGILSRDQDSCVYSRVIDIDLASVEPSLAGPSRPHDRVSISGLRDRFRGALREHGKTEGETFTISLDGGEATIGHGAIAIAAVTSCTTATDPAMMVAAGLAAKRACELGCRVPGWVKCVLAPGSHSTTDLLGRAGLIEPLSSLGFSVCGWGCMSCIGNSGPIFDSLDAVSGACELASVLSGNRNFEGRISPKVGQNYLAAPALVIAYALAGSVDIDLSREPVCEGSAGPVMLSDLLPSDQEVSSVLDALSAGDIYRSSVSGLMEGDAAWESIEVAPGSSYAWDASSTYVRRPPFVDDASTTDSFRLAGARALAYLGDFVTTDHISPAGSIAPDSPAARYLEERGIAPADFNTYGSRRGNHEVMMRGTFANVKLSNKLAEGRLGGWTKDPQTGRIASIFDAAESARAADTPLVVVAGRMYGSGSSRDWAAKGPALLGVRAVLAQSFERIHRSNLIGMGIMPLQFLPGETAESLGISGDETFDFDEISWAEAASAGATVRCRAVKPTGEVAEFELIPRVDTVTEAAYLACGGILPFVLEKLLAGDVAC